MKIADITPGLYRVKGPRKRDAEQVYIIGADPRIGTRFRDFREKGGYGIDTKATRLHIEATRVDAFTKALDPWSTFIRARDIIAPFTFPEVTKDKPKIQGTSIVGGIIDELDQHKADK